MIHDARQVFAQPRSQGSRRLAAAKLIRTCVRCAVALLLVNARTAGTSAQAGVRVDSRAQAEHAVGTAKIDFEDVATACGQPPPVPVTYCYSSADGVVFDDVAADCAVSGIGCIEGLDYGRTGFAHSGTNYIEACYGVEGCTNPINMTFRVDQTRLKVWVGYSGIPLANQETVILRVYDSTPMQVGEARATLDTTSPPTPINVPLEVRAAQIHSATVGLLDAEGPSGTVFNIGLDVDDVEFDGPTPPGCSDAPTVTISGPADGAEFDQPSITISGTVSGDSLPSRAVVTVIDLLPPPHDFTPPFTYSVPLSGTGNTRTFTQTVDLKLGYQAINVTARNDCGLSGQATARVTNLPAAIRARHAREGGGALQYTLGYGPKCPIAVYQDMAIAKPSWSPGNVTYVVREPILGKWKGWVSKDTHEEVPDFCPTGELQGLSQGFGSGRIYKSGPYFVPKVFADAMQNVHLSAGYDGETSTGVPISDPLESPTAHTWLFQQFRRGGDLLDSTLEIKGEPPVLYLEREGGGANWGHAGGATVSETAPCSAIHGPCDLTPPVTRAQLTTDDTLRNCHYTTFNPNPAVEPREWEPVQGTSDCDTTTGVGFLTVPVDSHLSGDDLATTHDPSPCCTFYGSGGGPVYDWNFDIIPQSSYPLGGMNQDYDYLQVAGRVKMELEVETCHMKHFTCDAVGAGLRPGALLQASGRWIIDCGHDDRSPEIHPIGLLAYMRTSTDPPPALSADSYCYNNPRVTYCNGPVTLATISTNGFWSGVPTDVLISPPPRPSPNAELCIHFPPDSEASVGLNPVAWTTDPDFEGYVKATFSKPHAPHCPFVETWYGGQMFPLTSDYDLFCNFPTGIQYGEYYGVWVVGWSTGPTSVENYDY